MTTSLSLQCFRCSAGDIDFFGRGGGDGVWHVNHEGGIKFNNNQWSNQNIWYRSTVFCKYCHQIPIK